MTHLVLLTRKKEIIFLYNIITVILQKFCNAFDRNPTLPCCKIPVFCFMLQFCFNGRSGYVMFPAHLEVRENLSTVVFRHYCICQTGKTIFPEYLGLISTAQNDCRFEMDCLYIQYGHCRLVVSLWFQKYKDCSWTYCSPNTSCQTWTEGISKQ